MIKRAVSVFLVATILVGGYVATNRSNRVVDVSMVSLIANPLKFHGRHIRVWGVSYTDFIESPGATLIFLTKEHAEMFILENSIRIHFDLGRPSDDELTE